MIGKILVIGLLSFLVAVGLLYFLISEKLKEKDMEFQSLTWSEDINWEEICSECEQGECKQKLESKIYFPTFEKIDKKFVKNYIECVEIIDGVDMQETKSSSLLVMSPELETFNGLDPTKPHTIGVCCGLQMDCDSEDVLTRSLLKIRRLIGFEDYEYYHVCKNKTIEARC
jgi:hypothetical protein